MNSANMTFKVSAENVVNELFPVHKALCAMPAMLWRHGSFIAESSSTRAPMPVVESVVALRLLYRTTFRTYQGPAKTNKIPSATAASSAANRAFRRKYSSGPKNKTGKKNIPDALISKDHK